MAKKRLDEADTNVSYVIKGAKVLKEPQTPEQAPGQQRLASDMGALAPGPSQEKAPPALGLKGLVSKLWI